MPAGVLFTLICISYLSSTGCLCLAGILMLTESGNSLNYCDDQKPLMSCTISYSELDETNIRTIPNIQVSPASVKRDMRSQASP